MDKFDVLIIGSGPGGYVAAIRAGQLGLKTAIVEKDKELGGTCLNVGCIPSKALLTSTDHFMFAKKEAEKHGIVIENAHVDLNKMQQRKDKVVKTMNSGVRSLMKTNKVTTFEGLGTITAQGITFHLETKVGAVKIDNGRATATATKGNEELKFEADKVLVSVGRKPFSEGLGAEKAGVEFDETKRIKVDEHFKTNIDGIYAIGDVIAGPMLAHKASEEGIACVERIAGKDGHINYDAIAGIIYTNPELAGVGLTEDQAKEKKIDYHVGRFPFRASGRAVANDDLEGIVKFIADAKTDRILGAHILQHAASELIAEAVSVIEFGGSSEDLARTCHSHPTLSEAVKEAAMNVEKRALHIINR